MNQYPLIKINLVFITGIIIQSTLAADIRLLAITGFILLVLDFILFFIKYSRTALLITLLSVISAGALTYSFAVSGLKDYPFKETKISSIRLYGRIISIQPPGSYELRFTLLADSASVKEMTFPLNHNILCRVRNSQPYLKKLAYYLKPGNIIWINGSLTRAPGQRNPGEFDYYDYLHRENISALLTSYDSACVHVSGRNTDQPGSLIYSAQLAVSRAIENLLNKEAASLLKGLILADRSGIDPDITNDFINAGVIHILSVSGLHIGYIILMFVFLTGRIKFTYRVPLILVGIIVYTMLTGAPPSVTRASLMTSIIFIALLTNRSINLLNTLSLTCLISLIFNPLDLFHPGFQLSYAAVGAIALFYYYFGDYFKALAVKHKSASRCSVFFLISLFAQAGTLPFTIYYFGKVSVVSLLVNVFVIPAAGLILGAGIFMLVVNMISAGTAMIYASGINFMVYLLYSCVHFFSANQWSYFILNQFSILDAVIFYSLFILIILVISRKGSLMFKCIVTTGAVLFFITVQGMDDHQLLPEGKLSIMAIDVGQGDACLLRFPDGRTAMIDAGNTTEFLDNGKRVIMPLLERLGIKSIDCAFISHMDDDHYEGFVYLIKRNLIKRIYKPPLIPGYEKDLRFEQWLKSRHIQTVHYRKQVIREGNARIYVLEKPGKDLNMNDASGVLKIVYGKTSVLFLGDTEKAGDNILINSYASFLKSDILKLGHHGSRGGTTEGLLKAVKPRYAIISAGRNNSFNHPAPETLNRLEQYNIKALRTDVEGAVLITSDGKKIEIINWRK